MNEKIDTSDEACAVVCMLVSNPSDSPRLDGWQRRVNDLIRTLRDERNELTTELAKTSTVANNILSDNRDLRAENSGYRKAHEMDEAEIVRLRADNEVLRAALIEIEKIGWREGPFTVAPSRLIECRVLAREAGRPAAGEAATDRLGDETQDDVGG